MTAFTDLSLNQHRVFLDIEQVFGAYRDARQQAKAFPGWMVWKKAGGHEYLFHAYDREGGKGKGLGRRSRETEAKKAKFDAGKKRLDDLIDELDARLKEYATASRAYRLRRVPTIAAKILRELDARELLGNAIIVVGTNALYAYEAAAGVQFFPDYLATSDLDLLWESRKGMELSAIESIEPDGFLGLLKSVDKLFTRNEERTFQAIGRDGYIVDLLKPIGGATERMTNRDKIAPMEIEGQQWLLDSERFEQTGIADDGFPLRLSCPDPRVFVVHKLWLSEQKKRNPKKARRDRMQAQVVAELLSSKLTQLNFADVRSNLPKELKPYLKPAMQLAAMGMK